MLVPGGFGDRGLEGKIAAIGYARSKKKPFLGICLGLQCAAIEFARSELGIKEASSAEVDPNLEEENRIIIEMLEHHGGDMGGTMRLGKRQTNFVLDNYPDHQCNTRSLYSIIYRVKDCGNDGKGLKSVFERHRHRYEVNPQIVPKLERKGLLFVGRDESGERMEILELDRKFGHPYFVGTQFHPEYLSRPLKPSPPFLGLILAAAGKLDAFLRIGDRSPRSGEPGDQLGGLTSGPSLGGGDPIGFLNTSMDLNGSDHESSSGEFIAVPSCSQDNDNVTCM